MIKQTSYIIATVLVGTLLIAGCAHTRTVATTPEIGQQDTGENRQGGLKESAYTGKLGYVWYH